MKEALTIPVIGNGDVFNVETALKMFSETHCDGIMIGRAAVTRPWIFRDLREALWGRGDVPPPPPPREVFDHYIMLLGTHFPPERRLGRLKEFTSYFAGNFFFGHTLWKSVQGARSVDQAQERAALFFESLNEQPHYGCQTHRPEGIGC